MQSVEFQFHTIASIYRHYHIILYLYTWLHLIYSMDYTCHCAEVGYEHIHCSNISIPERRRDVVEKNYNKINILYGNTLYMTGCFKLVWFTYPFHGLTNLFLSIFCAYIFSQALRTISGRLTSLGNPRSLITSVPLSRHDYFIYSQCQNVVIKVFVMTFSWITLWIPFGSSSYSYHHGNQSVCSIYVIVIFTGVG